MTLPLPNEEETIRFQELYREKTGTDMSQEEAYEALSRLAQLIYLIEIEPFRSAEEFARGKCAIEDVQELIRLRRRSHPVLGDSPQEMRGQESTEG